MEKMLTVCAVVVTRNRKNFLLNCLKGLMTQTHCVDAIYIVDNASSDGTINLLKEEGYVKEVSTAGDAPSEIRNKIISESNCSKEVDIYYVRMHRNTGGAGGFYEGMRRCCEKGYDWCWLMDDDVVLRTTSLENLFSALSVLCANHKKVGFLCSNVRGRCGLAMNVPLVADQYYDGLYPEWGEFLKYGLVKVKASTFVSMLVSRKVMCAEGLPIKDFFIWGDDTEYTLRISCKYDCYLVGTSEVVHLRETERTPSILSENNPERIKCFYFKFRNEGYICRNYRDYYYKLSLPIFYLRIFFYIFRILFGKSRFKFLKIRTIIRALFDSLFFNPPIFHF